MKVTPNCIEVVCSVRGHSSEVIVERFGELKECRKGRERAKVRLTICAYLQLCQVIELM